MKSIIYFILLITSCIFTSLAETTNTTYTTELGYDSEFVGNGSEFDKKSWHTVYLENLKWARLPNDSLPAQQFPEGNWGKIEAENQLSLRFTKTTFTNGKPIEAILLLRNVSGKWQPDDYTDEIDPGFCDGPIGFRATSSDGRDVLQHYWQGGTTTGHPPYVSLNADAQKLFIERFDKRFDLTNDTYSVQAFCVVGRYIGNCTLTNGRPVYTPSPTYVKSAKVTIKIE